MNTLKNLALLAIGATVGYLAAVWNLEKKDYVETDEDVVPETKNDKKLDPETKRLRTTTYGLSDSQTEFTKESPGEFDITGTAATAIRNYQQGINPSPEIPEEDDSDVGLNDNPNDPTEPYIISVEDYNNNDDHEKLEVRYYSDDNVVCDAANVKLSSAFIQSHIGRDNLAKLGDDFYIWVRSEQFEQDFEVAYIPGSYSVEIQGHTLPDGDRVA